MEITITWHLLVMIVITVLLLVGVFKGSDGELDFSSFWYVAIIVIIWLVYGGVFLW